MAACGTPRRLAGLVVICAMGLAAATDDGDLVYARLKYRVAHGNGSVELLEQLSGVYALYVDGVSVAGTVVIANPLDGCSPSALSARTNRDDPFILLARLDSSSSCSPLEQALYAEQVGAAGLVNMAPTRSSFIYLLERRPDEAGVGAPTIPQVAISGASGFRLLTAALNNPNAVLSISGPQEQVVEESTLDLIIAVACMILAIIVLGYAFKVGRTLCLQPQHVPIEESVEDIEERNRKVKAFLTTIPAEPYAMVGDGDVDDVCAICLEGFGKKDEVRTLRCNHYFHAECIDPWLLTKPNCPLCKDNVLESFEWTTTQNPLAGDEILLTHSPSEIDVHELSQLTAAQIVMMSPAERSNLVRRLSDSSENALVYIPPAPVTNELLPAVSESSIDAASSRPSFEGRSKSLLPRHVTWHRQISREGEDGYLAPVGARETNDATPGYDNMDETGAPCYAVPDTHSSKGYAKVDVGAPPLYAVPAQRGTPAEHPQISRLDDHLVTEWDQADPQRRGMPPAVSESSFSQQSVV